MKWRLEICQEIALKYKYRSDFKKLDKLAYDACVKNKYLTVVCSHMKYKTKKSGYWTYEKCKNVALKYNSLSDFEKNNSTAYNKCLKNNCLYDICSHMILKHKPNNYWTKEKCQEIALKYLTRSDFREYDASVYRTSISNKWLDEICSHMEYTHIYWTYDLCQVEALKYNNRSEFQINSGSAYAHASRHNYLKDICSHMIKIGNREYRCIYVFEFDDNYAYVGLTYNIKNREQDHLRKGPINKHIEKTNNKYKLIQLTDYINKKDAQIKEEYYMTEYENNNWILLNTNKKSTLGGSTIFWTYDRCKEEALKYIHKDDFLKNNHSAAGSAIKNGWYSDICSHMIPKKRKNTWTDEEKLFLITNHDKGFKFCSKELKKSYNSVRSQYQKIINLNF